CSAFPLAGSPGSLGALGCKCQGSQPVLSTDLGKVPGSALCTRTEGPSPGSGVISVQSTLTGAAIFWTLGAAGHQYLRCLAAHPFSVPSEGGGRAGLLVHLCPPLGPSKWAIRWVDGETTKGAEGEAQTSVSSPCSAISLDTSQHLYLILVECELASGKSKQGCGSSS
ncbi:hypothetical protein H1C71_021233, partial [Ictidomys tridecemlineatus]